MTMTLNANAFNIPLEDKTAQCVVTSPPYWSLRDYGVDGQIGIEPTPELYVSHIVQVFREVRRVLRDNGVVWLNLGTSYWGGKGKSGYELPHEAEERRAKGETFQAAHNAPGCRDQRPSDGKHPIFKPKDLVPIPWMVGLALQADGWWLRSDIIWSKTNPKPESVGDRCTRSHEYVFLLTKSRRYYYDQDAIREPHAASSLARAKRGVGENKWNTSPPDTSMHTMSKPRDRDKSRVLNLMGRNKWTVWSTATASFHGEHYATFPAALVEPMILAGTSARGECPVCGLPWERITVKTVGHSTDCPKTETAHRARGGGGRLSGTVGKSGGGRVDGTIRHVGWRPTCKHNAEPIPQLVLDPFAGTGTVGVVAIRHRRQFIGLDLNPEYATFAAGRTRAVQMALALETW